ncbi:SLATT domain-containing protein [Candidatus Peregrinibacteria bacterium]|nr:MAG: SLATT domain-containing protein [Candidatus Peregrinibacteria bacterium]
MKNSNLEVVRHSFANTVFTHKVQESAAERTHEYVFWVKFVNILMVALVLLSLSLQLAYLEQPIFSSIGIGLTIAEIIFLIIQLTFSYEAKEVSHKNAAIKYLGLRDRYKNFIADIMDEEISKAELKAKRDAFQTEYQQISDLAPQTCQKDYDKAQEKLNKKGVVKGEEYTWSDEEIDRFLPESLRLNNK